MKNEEGKYISVYDSPSKYTILWFWDPDCGHCKKSTPKLVELYKKYDRTTLEVFAIGIMKEHELWVEFIKEKKLDWINLEDVNYQSNFRSDYDIRTTPVLILLNDNMEIIAKNITVETLEEVLDQIIEQEKKK
ncbi:MAG: thioredoxin fold domain-containing protein [Bacteroidetes bacterium]|nr:thioredoxin fold domain-containing protein [Bacteroidota bacterium]